MLLKDEGFVIRQTKYGEKSIISKVLTKRHGLVNLIYSRSAKKNNVFFHPLNSIEFSFYHSKKSDVHRIKDISLKTSYLASNSKIIVSSLLFFLAEFLDKTLKEEGISEDLFLFVENQMKRLHEPKTRLANYHINFVFNLLPHFGVEPNINPDDTAFDLLEGCSSPAINGSYLLEESDFLLLKQAHKGIFLFSKEERERILDILIEYIDLQIGSKLSAMKSRDVLRVIFE